MMLTLALSKSSFVCEEENLDLFKLYAIAYFSRSNCSKIFTLFFVGLCV